jgi:hypothetical protein
MMLKNVKKKVVIGLGILGVFALGNITGATSDWQTNAINNAYSELLGTASQTTTELTSDVATDINTKIQTEIQGTVDEQQAELQRLLDQYYQMKINGLTSSPEFLQIESQIEQIKANVLEAYKKQIDEAFANQ